LIDSALATADQLVGDNRSTIFIGDAQSSTWPPVRALLASSPPTGGHWDMHHAYCTAPLG